MNCHGSNTTGGDGQENGHSRKGHMSHMLMMVLCCAVPIVILLLLPVIGRIGGAGISKALSGIVPFLCPLMMIIMMAPMIFKGRKEKDAEGK